MKKQMLGVVLSILLVLFMTQSAHAFLSNWSIDFDGGTAAGNDMVVKELVTLENQNFVKRTNKPNSTTEFDFVNYGAVDFGRADGETDIPGNYELTGVFRYEGQGSTADGVITFDRGWFEFWVDDDPTSKYTTASSPDPGDQVYGARDGQKIATFDLLYGEGGIDGKAVPNGLFTLYFEATWFEDDYMFMDDGYDMADFNPADYILGYSTTNASLSNPSAGSVKRAELLGFADTIQDEDDFFLAGGGQYRLDSAVPVPPAVLLLGSGLVGLLGLRRKNS
jgi:hypothetical protein